MREVKEEKKAEAFCWDQKWTKIVGDEVENVNCEAPLR
jgi:hypothetical protein